MHNEQAKDREVEHMKSLYEAEKQRLSLDHDATRTLLQQANAGVCSAFTDLQSHCNRIAIALVMPCNCNRY
jgi:UDP-3-O-[3-hydroxymyristoyl] glucosamine N-acyltransferase